MDGANKGTAGRIADTMKSELGDVAAQAARTAVESNLDQAAAAVQERYGAVLDPAAKVADHAAEATGKLSGLVRERPFAALAVAAVVGFVFGRL